MPSGIRGILAIARWAFSVHTVLGKAPTGLPESLSTESKTCERADSDPEPRVFGSCPKSMCSWGRYLVRGATHVSHVALI